MDQFESDAVHPPIYAGVGMRLYLYFALRFFYGFARLFLIFIALTALIEMIEALRKFDSSAIGFVQILRITALRLPISLYEIAPLIVMLSTIQVFLSLAKSGELVIARASGRSALLSILSPVLVAFVFGMILVAVFNPIVAATTKQYESLNNQFLKGSSSVLSISREGLWLRQGSETGQVVVHAKRSNSDATELFDVTFVGFSTSGDIEFRVSGESAKLTAGAWTVKKAKEWRFDIGDNAERDAKYFGRMAISTNLTAEQIHDGFGQPSTIPIWELPAFIDRLKQAGFSPRRHQIWFQSELALPTLLATMVLVGAIFTLGHSRSGSTGMMVLFALASGFSLFFVRNFALVLGENGQIPVLLAAWAPLAAAIFLALGLILHAEDG